MYEIGGDVTLNGKIINITGYDSIDAKFITLQLSTGQEITVRDSAINTYAPPYKATEEDRRKGN